VHGDQSGFAMLPDLFLRYGRSSLLCVQQQNFLRKARTSVGGSRMQLQSSTRSTGGNCLCDHGSSCTVLCMVLRTPSWVRTDPRGLESCAR
jgi:hypothetical protein